MFNVSQITTERRMFNVSEIPTERRMFNVSQITTERHTKACLRRTPLYLALHKLSCSARTDSVQLLNHGNMLLEQRTWQNETVGFCTALY